MKLYIKLTILFLVHLILCMSFGYASAQEPERKWTNYRKDTMDVEYYYDQEAVLRPSKNVIQVWRKRVFPTREHQKEIVTFDEINCRLQQYRTLELRVIRWDDTIQTSSKPTPWQKIWAGSSEEYLLDEVCMEKPKPPE